MTDTLTGAEALIRMLQLHGVQACLRPVWRHQPALLRRAGTAGPWHPPHPDARRTQRRLHGRRLRPRDRPCRRVRRPQRRWRHLPAAGAGGGQRVQRAGAGLHVRRAGVVARQVPADGTGPAEPVPPADQVERHRAARRPAAACGAHGLSCHDHRPPRRGAPVPALRRAEAAAARCRAVGPARPRDLAGPAQRARCTRRRARGRPAGGRPRAGAGVWRRGGQRRCLRRAGRWPRP
jgi:hypothetical protein